MIGINETLINNLITKNEYYLDFVNNNIKNMTSSMNELLDCYSGTSLNYLFSDTIREIKNVEKIPGIIRNYSEVLYSVKYFYKKQDTIIAQQFMNKKVN